MIDLGSTSVRTAVADASGHLRHTRRLPTPRRSPAPGLMEFDPVALAETAMQAATATLRDAGPVDAVGIANQRASTVVWDRLSGEPAGPGLGWQDLRTALAALQRDPSLIPTATEEILRWTTVTMHFRRTATTDVEVGGRLIREGDKVVLWWVAADYDERNFPDPYRFDIGRSPNDHVAFGRNGPHLCLGAWLARMEVRLTLEELLPRVASIELAGHPERLRSNFISGVKHLPVRVRPA